MNEQRGLNALAEEVHATAVDRGWCPKGEEVNTMGKLMLIVTEVSEAAEEYRAGNPVGVIEYQHLGPEPHTYRRSTSPEDDTGNWVGKPVGFATELADVIIRTLDLAAALGIDIEDAMRVKMDYNTTRPTRHGGKLI